MILIKGVSAMKKLILLSVICSILLCACVASNGKDGAIHNQNNKADSPTGNSADDSSSNPTAEPAEALVTILTADSVEPDNNSVITPLC